jgi:hypothetical protein
MMSRASSIQSLIIREAAYGKKNTSGLPSKFVDGRPLPEFVARNTTDSALKTGHVVEVTGYDTDLLLFEISKPEDFSITNMAICKTSAEIGDRVELVMGGIMVALVDVELNDSDEVISSAAGSQVGPQADKFTMKLGGEGFTVLGPAEEYLISTPQTELLTFVLPVTEAAIKPPWWPLIRYNGTTGNAEVKFVPATINGIAPDINSHPWFSSGAFLSISTASAGDGVIYAKIDKATDESELLYASGVPGDDEDFAHFATHLYYIHSGRIFISPLFHASLQLTHFAGGLVY